MNFYKTGIFTVQVNILTGNPFSLFIRFFYFFSYFCSRSGGFSKGQVL